jgi:hypothetical protein
LSSGIWTNDVRNDLSDIAFLQFICIWIAVQEIQLVPGVADHHIWTPSFSGTYSVKSAYERFFVGAVNFKPADRIWRMWAPLKCKFFLWLAALNLFDKFPTFQWTFRKYVSGWRNEAERSAASSLS